MNTCTSYYTYLIPIPNNFRDFYNGSMIRGDWGQGRIHTRKRSRPLSFTSAYNITRDTFTLHDRPTDPFTFLYIQLPVRDCNACLSHSTGLSPVGIPFTLAAFHRHGIGKLFHAS